MGHCPSFWRKWRKEPNFCGLGPTTARSYDRYLKFVDELIEEYGIPEDIIYRNATHATIRPLLKFKSDSDIRKKAMRQIAQTIKDKHSITVAYVNHIIGIETPQKPLKVAPPIAAAAGISTEEREKSTVQAKIRLLNGVLTAGQKNILMVIMNREKLENEYEALAIALIWAKERIDAVG